MLWKFVALHAGGKESLDTRLGKFFRQVNFITGGAYFVGSEYILCYDKQRGNLAKHSIWVIHTDAGTFADWRVLAGNIFHFNRGNFFPADIDDIVRAPEHMDIAIRVCENHVAGDKPAIL